jgi:iron complex outermembrane recepter protein
MNSFLFRLSGLSFLYLLLSLPAFTQTRISGVIFDAQSKETIIGATVRLKYFAEGTVTDLDGNFELSTDLPLPLTVEITALDFQRIDLLVLRDTQGLIIMLEPEAAFGKEVVVSASRMEESVLESPVSIQRVGVVDIRHAASLDPYLSVGNLEGVQVNTSSMRFTSVNTRGFADAQNWRFVTLVDGVDIIGPGLNYTLGSITGAAELDMLSMELVPGPGSALYGPNAFNGLLSMQTKNPFDYEGLSAYVKGGMSVQQAAGTRPFTDVGIRYAKRLSDQWAYKFNVSYFTGTDWEANDQSHLVGLSDRGRAAELLSRDRDHPNYNAVNVYGDEVRVPVRLDTSGVSTLVNRSGFAEKDILDYSIGNVKIQGALHYRPMDGLEVIYSGSYIQADVILRHTTIYPLVNIHQHLNRLELKGEDFFLRGYYAGEDANDSYALLGTGAFIQEGLKSSALWSADYGAAFRGEVPGIEAGSHQASRLFADRDIPGPTSEQFQALREQTLTNPNILTGGSQFIDKSGMLHLEGMYDFSRKLGFIDLQEGISYRRYYLNSEGRLFNDGGLGFGKVIPIVEYGAYAQASKRLMRDRLALRGSLRFDKNQNFEGRVSPRASAVLSLGAERQHHVRVSTQTGFRNPASQETYIALDIGEAIILGGTEDNIENYRYETGDGTIRNGSDIYREFVTIPSVQAFLGGGGVDPTVLRRANLDFLRQERISTVELGYKGLINKNLLVDVHMYRNRYQDFVTRIPVYSLLVNRAYAIYTNIADDITSIGGGATLQYQLPSSFLVDANYSYADFDAEEAQKNNPEFVPAFNTPKHRFQVGLSNKEVGAGIGFNVRFRWSDGYLWQSPFGQGEIDSYQVVDAAVTYKLTAARSLLKIGANNLFNQEYRQLYGGPNVGSHYYISIAFDEMFR